MKKSKRKNAQAQEAQETEVLVQEEAEVEVAIPMHPLEGCDLIVQAKIGVGHAGNVEESQCAQPVIDPHHHHVTMM